MLSTDVKGALLILFHRNPHLKDSLQGLAALIGKTPNEIIRDVKDLTDLGLLTHDSSTGVELISWSVEKDEEIQELAARLSMCEQKIEFADKNEDRLEQDGKGHSPGASRLPPLYQS